MRQDNFKIGDIISIDEYTYVLGRISRTLYLLIPLDPSYQDTAIKLDASTSINRYLSEKNAKLKCRFITNKILHDSSTTFFLHSAHETISLRKTLEYPTNVGSESSTKTIYYFPLEKVVSSSMYSLYGTYTQIENIKNASLLQKMTPLMKYLSNDDMKYIYKMVPLKNAPTINLD